MSRPGPTPLSEYRQGQAASGPGEDEVAALFDATALESRLARARAQRAEALAARQNAKDRQNGKSARSAVQRLAPPPFAEPLLGPQVEGGGPAELNGPRTGPVAVPDPLPEANPAPASAGPESTTDARASNGADANGADAREEEDAGRQAILPIPAGRLARWRPGPLARRLVVPAATLLMGGALGFLLAPVFMGDPAVAPAPGVATRQTAAAPPEAEPKATLEAAEPSAPSSATPAPAINSPGAAAETRVPDVEPPAPSLETVGATGPVPPIASLSSPLGAPPALREARAPVAEEPAAPSLPPSPGLSAPQLTVAAPAVDLLAVSDPLEDPDPLTASPALAAVPTSTEAPQTTAGRAGSVAAEPGGVPASPSRPAADRGAEEIAALPPMRDLLPQPPSEAPAARPKAPRRAEGDAPSNPAGLATQQVFVHFPPNAAADAEAAVAALRAAGMENVVARPVTISISQSNVRFFHRADAPAARAVADALGDESVDTTPEVRDFTHFRPRPEEGRLELWLSGNAPVSTQRAAGNGSARGRSDAASSQRANAEARRVRAQREAQRERLQKAVEASLRDLLKR